MPRTPLVDGEANGHLTSPRRKQPAATRHIPTPVSNSPSTSKHSPTSTLARFPPAFESTFPAHFSSHPSVYPGEAQASGQSAAQSGAGDGNGKVVHHAAPPRAMSDAAGTTFSCPAGLGLGASYAAYPGRGLASAHDSGPEHRGGATAVTPVSGVSHRYTPQYTPRSPYRPGEYARRDYGRASVVNHASERTRIGIERRLFDESEEDEDAAPKRNRGSSPLQPPFEARLILRKGASVDIISWLRKNFHHIPSPAHNNLTPSTSLLAIRALIAERFPRQPEPAELVKAVTVAFPRSHWDYPSNESEPPMIRGLVWNGKELHHEAATVSKRERSRDRVDNNDAGRAPMQTPERRRKGREPAQIVTDLPAVAAGAVRSPTMDTSQSPSSSSKRPPNTPARSVLDDFAELATLADKSPKSAHGEAGDDGAGKAKGRGKKGKAGASGALAPPAPAYALANICNSEAPGMDGVEAGGMEMERVGSQTRASRKRRAAEEAEEGDGVGSDKLGGLLAAASAVDVAGQGSVLAGLGVGLEREMGAGIGHKRRRTIGGIGAGGMRDIMGPEGMGWGAHAYGHGHGHAYSHAPPHGIANGRAAYPPSLGPPHRAFLGSAWSGHGSAGGSGPWRAHGQALGSLPESDAVHAHAGVARGDAHSVGDTDEADAALHARSRDVVGAPLASASSRERARGDAASIATSASQGSGSASIVSSALPSVATPARPVHGRMWVQDDKRAPEVISASAPTRLAPLPPPEAQPERVSAEQASSASAARGKPPRARKANELPTEGDAPGIDCKPPHPYHEMIRHAIESAPDKRLQLSQIYASIAERFPFFKTLDEKKTAGWQNSIRHNLSLKKMFVRVNKVDPPVVPLQPLPPPTAPYDPNRGGDDDGATVEEGGKGGWWTVQMGIPDEGRPGRKVKTSGAASAAAAKRRKEEAAQAAQAKASEAAVVKAKEAGLGSHAVGAGA